jgi:hypothetical protein
MNMEDKGLRNFKRELLGIGAMICLVVAMVAIVQHWRGNSASGRASYLVEFAAEIKSNASPAVLRGWADQMRREWAHPTDTRILKPIEIPGFVKHMYRGETPWVYVFPLSTRNAYIEISYGGGFGHWGLLICPEDLRALDHDSGHFVDSLEWSPGMFVISRE